MDILNKNQTDQGIDDISSAKSSVSHSLNDSDCDDAISQRKVTATVAPKANNAKKVMRPRQATLGRYKMQEILKAGEKMKKKITFVT